jgi:hypothetical protein
MQMKPLTLCVLACGILASFGADAARSNTGNSAGYKFVGVIENVGGATAIVGAVTKTAIAEDIAAWDVNVTADNVNDALVITVNGDNTSVRWVATVKTTEVTN